SQLKLLHFRISHFSVFALEDSGGEFVNQAVAVGSHQHSRSALVDLLEYFHDAIRHFGVEVTGRLVCEEYLGFVDECPCNHNALLLATRELMRHFLFYRTETDLHQNFGEACAHFCTIAPASSFHYEMKVFTDSSIVEELKVL